ncbi:hypothetical protein HK098_001971 [Nowakowskiella sp. JEL0407]|nr:hypothetical protein HK098_001971 [Nowakowskiella sp. JEL0407]
MLRQALRTLAFDNLILLNLKSICFDVFFELGRYLQFFPTLKELIFTDIVSYYPRIHSYNSARTNYFILTDPNSYIDKGIATLKNLQKFKLSVRGRSYNIILNEILEGLLCCKNLRSLEIEVCSKTAGDIAQLLTNLPIVDLSLIFPPFEPETIKYSAQFIKKALKACRFLESFSVLIAMGSPLPVVESILESLLPNEIRTLDLKKLEIHDYASLEVSVKAVDMLQRLKVRSLLAGCSIKLYPDDFLLFCDVISRYSSLESLYSTISIPANYIEAFSNALKVNDSVRHLDIYIWRTRLCPANVPIKLELNENLRSISITCDGLEMLETLVDVASRHQRLQSIVCKRTCSECADDLICEECVEFLMCLIDSSLTICTTTSSNVTDLEIDSYVDVGIEYISVLIQKIIQKEGLAVDGFFVKSDTVCVRIVRVGRLDFRLCFQSTAAIGTIGKIRQIYEDLTLII